jgi:hypothetical protein
LTATLLGACAAEVPRQAVAWNVGTVYRKVQVEIASNAVTEVQEGALRRAGPSSIVEA